MLSQPQKEKLELSLVAVFLALVMAASMALVLALVFKNKSDYENALNKPPTLFEVEERCEQEFWTTDLIVYEMVEEGEGIAIYTIKANGLYFKVKFGIKNNWGSGVYWDYIDYKPIAESEIK